MAKRKAIKLTDPRALRAYAHPTRLALMGLLRRAGPMTATQAGERIGESAASCSFHLRQLAKFGLVEEAGGGRAGTAVAGDRGHDRMAGAGAEPRLRGGGGDADAGRRRALLRVGDRMARAAARGTRGLGRNGGRQRPHPLPHRRGAGGDPHQVRALLDPLLERSDPAKRPAGARAVNYIQLGFPFAEDDERLRRPRMRRHACRTLLRTNEPFRRFWTGQTISLFGDQISLLAIPLLAVLTLHAGAAQMGLLGAVELAPNLLFAIHLGAWADGRRSRRALLIAADLGRAALLLALPIAAAFGALSMGLLYAVAFCVGTLAVVFEVGYQTVFASLVDPGDYLAANSLLVGSRSVSLVGGKSSAASSSPR